MSLHDPKWLYHPAASHWSAEDFNERQKDRVKKSLTRREELPGQANPPPGIIFLQTGQLN